MLVNKQNQAFVEAFGPLKTLPASFRQRDGLFALGAVGAIAVFQQLRRLSTRRRGPDDTGKPSRPVQVFHF